jgi:Flp pilus assembly protein TadD
MTKQANNMTKKPSISLLTGLSITVMALSACQTTGTTTEKSLKEQRTDQIAAAIRRAEDKSGKGQSISTLEKRYKRNTDSEIDATKYAHALRKNDFLPEAAAVLAPFAEEETASAPTKTEYALILLAQGQHKRAEKTAQQAVLADETYDRAYHTLGIALDTQGMHEEAERAFRKGLELWQGDPTTIMNNLALNLAAQNHLDEASEILQKAQVLAPQRMEIERNLRIVTALQQSHSKPAPKPPVKPEITIAPKAEEPTPPAKPEPAEVEEPTVIAPEKEDAETNE